MYKMIVVLLSLIVASPTWSFNCYLTVAKGSCWKNYNVTIEAIDSINSKSLIKMTVPQGKDWERQPFTCEPAQRLTYQASFTPTIWEQDKGKIYKPFKFMFLPKEVKPGEKAWVVSVCFPANFAETPLPPDAGAKCACDFESIPPLPPQ